MKQHFNTLYPRLLFALVLLIAIGNWVNGDDIVYTIILSRYWLDQQLRIFVFPHCTAGFIIDPPTLWRLPAVFFAALYSLITSHLHLRITGVCLMLVNVYLLAKLAIPAAASTTTSQRATQIRSFFWHALFFGAFPFYFVITRPENYILLLTLLSLTLALNCRKRPNCSNLLKVLTTLTQLILALLAFSIHPVSLTMLLLFGLALWLVPHHATLRAAALCVGAYFVVVSYQAHTSVVQCPENPLINQFLERYAGEHRSLSVAPTAFIVERMKNLVTVKEYFWSFYFYERSMLGIRPHIPGAAPWLLHLARFSISLGFGFLFCLTLLIALRLYRERTRLQLVDIAIPVVAILTLALLSASQKEKFPYRLILVYPLFLLAITRLWSKLESTAFSELRLIKFERVVAGFKLSCVAGATCLLFLYGRPTQVLERFYALEPHTTGLFAFSRLRSDTAEAAKACQLDLSSGSKRLLLDTTTYFTGAQSREPINLEYLLNGVGEDFEQAVEDIVRLGSQGMLVRCDSIPSELGQLLGQNLQQFGKICCHPNFQHSNEGN